MSLCEELCMASSITLWPSPIHHTLVNSPSEVFNTISTPKFLVAWKSCGKSFIFKSIHKSSVTLEPEMGAPLRMFQAFPAKHHPVVFIGNFETCRK